MHQIKLYVTFILVKTDRFSKEILSFILESFQKLGKSLITGPLNVFLQIILTL